MSIVSYQTIKPQDFVFGDLEKKHDIYFCPIFYKKAENYLVTKTPAMVTASGLKRKRKRWSIDVDVREADLKTHRKWYNVVGMVDDLCIEETAARRQEWFGKPVTKRAIQGRYQSPMIPGWGDDPAKMRVEVLIEDSYDVVDKRHRDLDPSRVTPGTKVVLVMQLAGFWVDSNFLGAHWRVVKLIADAENPEADIREKTEIELMKKEIEEEKRRKRELEREEEERRRREEEERRRKRREATKREDSRRRRRRRKPTKSKAKPEPEPDSEPEVESEVESEEPPKKEEPKKKRGRKPTKKEPEPEEEKPKKRGRKPTKKEPEVEDEPESEPEPQDESEEEKPKENKQKDEDKEKSARYTDSDYSDEYYSDDYTDEFSDGYYSSEEDKKRK